MEIEYSFLQTSHRIQSIEPDVGIENANDPYAELTEKTEPGPIAADRDLIEVAITVDLDHEAELRAVKIDDEAADAVLTAELESQQLSTLQMTPKDMLGWRTVVPKTSTQIFELWQIKNTAHTVAVLRAKPFRIRED